MDELKNLFLDIEWSDAIFPASTYLAHIPADRTYMHTCGYQLVNIWPYESTNIV